MSTTHIVNGQPFNIYRCKHAERCRSFNPALTLQVTVAIKGHPETARTIEKLNSCMHGGCGKTI